METLAAIACAESSVDGALVDAFIQLKETLLDTQNALKSVQRTNEHLHQSYLNLQKLQKHMKEEQQALKDINAMLKCENLLLHETIQKMLKT